MPRSRSTHLAIAGKEPRPKDIPIEKEGPSAQGRFSRARSSASRRCSPAHSRGRWGSPSKRRSVRAESKVFTALADPTRRHIFEALREQPRTVGELAAGQPVSRPAVSQHLKVLEAARLVSVEPQGNRRLYSIERDGLDDLRQYLESFWSDALSAYGAEIARHIKDK